MFFWVIFFVCFCFVLLSRPIIGGVQRETQISHLMAPLLKLIALFISHLPHWDWDHLAVNNCNSV